MSECRGANNGQKTPVSCPEKAGYAGDSQGLLLILWRGRWLIVLSVLLAAAGAYAYLRLAPVGYRSTSRLLVDKPNPQPHFDAPQPAGSTLANYLATQASIIMSPEITTPALRDPNVLTRPTFSSPNYVKSLLRTLSADVAKKADIIEITALPPYPEDAAQIVNAVVRAYIRWHQANRQLTTTDLLRDLNAQLDNRYRELQAKRKEQMLFEQKYPEVLENSPGGMITTTLETLRTELGAARLKVIQCECFCQGLHRLENKPNALREYVYGHQASVANSAVAATGAAGEHSERVRLEIEREQTNTLLEEIQAMGPAQRSRLTVLQSRQRELEQKIANFDAEFLQQQVALAKTLLEDAHTEEEEITKIYDKEFAKLQSLGAQDSQYAFLKSECKMMEDLATNLRGQISQLDLGSRIEGLRIHVLEKAVPAERPSSPPAAQVMEMALVLGVMAGAGLSLLRDCRDQPVRSAAEIAAILGVPILGVIPSIRRHVIRGGSKLWFAAGSEESEACRTIRTALLCGAHRDQTKIILVTSPGPQEGKTTIVSNLAVVMAQVGLKTLLINADLRKPPPQRLFMTDVPRKGLVDVLTGAGGLGEAIRPTEIERLDLLERGGSTSEPAELLSGPGLTAVLGQLKSRYDCILIDSPPVGIVTDAQILATRCDATLLVLRADESSRLLTQEARDALHVVGARIAGAVVNDLSIRAGKYSYYRRYGYVYSHPPNNITGRAD